jgi:hypothetical protein
MHKLLIIGITAAVVLPLAAAAAEHRKPGLWQVTVQTNFTKGGPQISPQQKAQMQQMGVKIPGMGGATTTQNCLTPEQAAKDDHPDISHGDCQLQNQNWSGHTFTADMQCNGHGSTAHGHIQFVTNGDTSYTGTSHMEGNNPHLGGDFTMESQLSGQWQSADCGSVQPLTPPQK